MCPKSLIHHQPIQSSDHKFSEINKKSIDNPFSQAHIQGYLPTNPWEAAKAATSQLDKSTVLMESSIPSFPSVAQLDSEYDSWPESGNPFTTTEISDESQNQGTSITSSQGTTNINNSTDSTVHHSALPTRISAPPTYQSFSSLIQSIIMSEDKLFFIAYRNPNESRKEWKLVQLDFKLSIQQYPNCLQDGKFIFNFLIQHPKDKDVAYPHKRFWIEYHKVLTPKHLHTQYHIIQPSDISPKIADNQNLIPYREWINIKDQSILINGPFNFSTLNQRKTRDKIDIREWQILQQSYQLYDNEKPVINNTPVQYLHWNDPNQLVDSSAEVDNRVKTFVNNLANEINNTIQSMFEKPNM